MLELIPRIWLVGARAIIEAGVPVNPDNDDEQEAENRYVEAADVAQ